MLEARERIGGRIHTTNAWPDLPVDIGASWIHGATDNPVTALARAAGARTVVTAYDSSEVRVAAELRGAGLRKPDTARWEALVGRALAAVPTSGADLSLAAAIAAMPETRSLTPAQRADLGFYLASTYESEWGADASELSARTLDDGRGFEGADLLLPDGYQKLMAHLGDGLRIVLTAPVRAISEAGGQVSVATADQVLTVAAAIVTVPLSVLQRGSISFTPALPDTTAHALERLKMGCLSKTFLRFDAPFWPVGIDWQEYAGPHAGQWTEWVSFAKIGPALLLGLNSGAHARRIEAAPAADVVAEAMRALRDMFGPSVPEPRAVQTSSWSQDPYAGGSYSFPAVGSSPADRAALRQPVGERVFLAGEAVEPDYFGTVHGALLSGRDAAERVAALLA